ncbi:AraC family transcriptional regulator [Kocuria aegyptia]|uniref:AraC family transcriptional regulator n=2 Tax=Kocuria aegyptia TaxID=330943 RepID=A0ABP4WMJ3_9MICC
MVGDQRYPQAADVQAQEFVSALHAGGRVTRLGVGAHAGSMEFVQHLPPPPLAAFVTAACGYRVPAYPSGLHRGLPSSSMTLVIELGGRLRTTGLSTEISSQAVVCGLHTRPALIDARAPMDGVQYALTPLGSRALLGVPAGELHDRPVELAEVLGSAAVDVVDRLHEARTWDERFAVLDRALATHLEDSVAPVPSEVLETWRLVMTGQGRLPVSAIAAQVGWSRRHLAERFRWATGLTPKQLSRVARFEAARALLTDPTGPSLARTAALTGYADQSHLDREWRALAGCSPTTWMREELPFVQDDSPSSAADSGA